MADGERPDTADGWVLIAERELVNLRKAYEGKLTNDAKIDHALKATEAALKAVMWKANKWVEWPRRNQKPHLYYHELRAMLDELPNSVVYPLRRDSRTWASLQVLLNTSLKQSRYSPLQPSDDQTNEISRAARHYDTGVVTWLLKHYRTMK